MPRPPNPHPYRKTVTRWRMLDGKEAKPRTPGAVKHTEKSSTYYADIAGKVTALKTTNIAVAWKILREKLREEHERQLGVRDRFSEHAKTQLAEHLTAWLKVLDAKGTGAGQRDTIKRRLTNLFAKAKWAKLAEISSEGAILTLSGLVNKSTGKKISAQTRNHYISHLRGFASWLVLTGRLPSNPVLDLSKSNVENDRRHLRREPTPEEIAELFCYLEKGGSPVLRGMTGPRRALGYRVAMATGYRAGELGALTAESFDLAAKAVSLAPAADKRRKGDVHPLPDWLVLELQKWFAAGGECWPAFARWHPGRVLKKDLAAARQAWIDDAGDAKEKKRRVASDFLSYKITDKEGDKFLDFHALRVFYITELAGLPGMDLKTLMTLARHSTPQLSLGLYAKKREANLRAATDQLKPPGE